MRKKKQGRKTTNELGGPLVPIRVDRLRRVLRLRDMPVLQLAEKAGVRQQTVSAIVNAADVGKRRCRQAHLRSFAKVLRVDYRYLTGEIDRLSQARTSIQFDEDGFGVPLDTSDPEQLARFHLAEDEFGLRCYAAIIRDLIPMHGSRRRAEKAFVADDWWILLEGLTQMIRPWTWRAAVLKTPDRPRRSSRRTRARLEESEQEGLEALATGFEVVLQPWLDGTRELDVEVLGAVRRAIVAGWGKHQHPRPRRSRPTKS